MRRGLSLFFVFLFLTSCVSGAHRVKKTQSRVYFYLKNADAKSVLFACSQDGYKKHEATRIDESTWEVSVPLEGEFKYFYIVDGQAFTPDCLLLEDDDFGSKNCIFEK